MVSCLQTYNSESNSLQIVPVENLATDSGNWKEGTADQNPAEMMQKQFVRHHHAYFLLRKVTFIYLAHAYSMLDGLQQQLVSGTLCSDLFCQC